MRFEDGCPPGPHRLLPTEGSPSPRTQQQPKGKLYHEAGHPRSSHAHSPRGRKAQRDPGGSQGGCRDSQSQVPPLIPSPHHHQQALGGLNGAMKRGSRGGGRQAGEEVISPQLAPLPRSLKGRRKPPGPAPPPAPWPRLLSGQASAHTPPERMPAVGVQLSPWAHTSPSAPDPGSKCKYPLSTFPNAFQASVSPSVKQSQRPQLHSTGRFHQECVCHSASAQHQDHLPEISGISAK